MPDEVDPHLLERFVRGDQAAFESLFRQFQADVYGWILRITRDPGSAEDALVEAFWRAYRSRARFDPSRSFGAWIRRIATNAALDQLRAARVRAGTGVRAACDAVQVEPHDVRSGGSSAFAKATADRRSSESGGWSDPPSHDVADSIRAAFSTLPPRLAAVATLALIEERPYAEIAEALDVPIGTVKSRVFRATRLLRKELARLGVTP